MSKFSHVKTWLFDLDDTLYSPETGFSKYMGEIQHKSLAKQLGTDLSGVKVILKNLVKKHGGAPFTGLYKEKSIDMDAFIAEGFALKSDLLKPCALTRSMLQDLKGRKAIFTNSPKVHADNVLNALGYQDIFLDENVFDVTRLGFETKPKKEPYDIVVKSLSEQPENCVLIEDSSANLKTAKALGMTTVLVHTDAENCDWVDFSYATLQGFLEDVLS